MRAANARSIPIAQRISRGSSTTRCEWRFKSRSRDASRLRPSHVGNIGILGVEKRGQEHTAALGGGGDQHAA